MYNRTPHEQVTMSTDEWKSVLKLSKKWGMTSLRKHCINQLSPLPSDMPLISKVLFARECMAVDWLVDAYNELAQRKESLSEIEVTAIGLQSAIRLLRVREKWIIDQEHRSSHVSYSVSSRQSHGYHDSIRLMFRSEMSWIKNECLVHSKPVGDPIAVESTASSMAPKKSKKSFTRPKLT
jgi:hypothetical protein